MRGNFDLAFRELLVHEGGFVDHPKDPGGMTNLGVTRDTYEAWVGYPVSERIMRELTPGKVRALYKARYWDVVRGDELPAGLDLCVFDFAVNAGPARAVRYLQRLVGVRDDGIAGPKTVAAATERAKVVDGAVMVSAYQDARRDYHRMLPTFSTFGRGWLRRIDAVEKLALSLQRGMPAVQLANP